jgi:hypothetical protein
MKSLVAVSLLLTLSLIARPLHHAEWALRGTPNANRTPVIVELFTSEGCSSCPPADALLAKLENEQLVQSAEVIALEEHVDYWNDLGWTDPFSSRDWTARQLLYAGALGNGNAYTPQMVVDGTAEFVGSQERRARLAILEASGKEKTPLTIALTPPGTAGTEHLSVRVGKLRTATAADGPEVWLAVTETGLHRAVTGGENAGEDLHHAAVVRTMSKIGEASGDGETSFTGNATIPIAKAWNREKLRAVVFVQEKRRRRILGAAAVQFSP